MKHLILIVTGFFSLSLFAKAKAPQCNFGGKWIMDVSAGDGVYPSVTGHANFYKNGQSEPAVQFHPVDVNQFDHQPNFKSCPAEGPYCLVASGRGSFTLTSKEVGPTYDIFYVRTPDLTAAPFRKGKSFAMSIRGTSKKTKCVISGHWLFDGQDGDGVYPSESGHANFYNGSSLGAMQFHPIDKDGKNFRQQFDYCKAEASVVVKAIGPILFYETTNEIGPTYDIYYVRAPSIKNFDFDSGSTVHLGLKKGACE